MGGRTPRRAYKSKIFNLIILEEPDLDASGPSDARRVGGFIKNSKRFATPADPLLPMDVWMCGNIDVQLLGDSPLRSGRLWKSERPKPSSFYRRLDGYKYKCRVASCAL